MENANCASMPHANHSHGPHIRIFASSWEKAVAGRNDKVRLKSRTRFIWTFAAAFAIGRIISPWIIFPSLASPRRALTTLSGASTSPNPQNLRLAAADRDNIPHRLAEQRARQRRDMRERAMRRVGLVLADDAEGLTAAVVAFDADGCAELHAAQIGRRRDHLGAGAARAPIA